MTYTIRRGDTLSALAQRFGTTVRALAQANGIKDVNLIRAGATLKIAGDGFDRAAGTTRRGGSTFDAGGSSPLMSLGAPITGGTAAMRRLAEVARQVALGMGGYRGLGLCATGVSRAISSALGLSVHGNGNQIDNNLPPAHFKQVNMTLAEALKIPGLILTWEHTASGAGAIYGHTAITTGDGHSSTSDFVENNTLGVSGGRTGLKVFMPI